MSEQEALKIIEQKFDKKFGCSVFFGSTDEEYQERKLCYENHYQNFLKDNGKLIKLSKITDNNFVEAFMTLYPDKAL